MRGRNARGSNHARVESWTGVLRLGTGTTLRRRVAPTRRGSRESLQKSRPTPCEPAVTGLEMGIRQRFAGGQQGATIGPKLFREWRIRGAERRVGPRSGHAASAGSRQPDLRVGGVELRARRMGTDLGRRPGRAPKPHTSRGPFPCPAPAPLLARRPPQRALACAETPGRARNRSVPRAALPQEGPAS